MADRGNRRIQVFDGDGKLLRIITIDVPAPAGRPGRDRQQARDRRDRRRQSRPSSLVAPWALCITPKAAGKEQTLYVSDAFPGRIYKLTLDGKVQGYLGSTGKGLKQFGWIHEIACPSENELYVGELLELVACRS